MIRLATDADCDALARIYNHYVAETVVTFEEEPVAASEMAARVAAVRAAGLPWLVAEEEGGVVGYAYATRWKPRSAYRFAVETTVYLAPGAPNVPGVMGRGLGTALYAELFERVRALGMHVAIGGIALPNAASVALHEKMGMERVALFRQVGFKQGRWVDVAYWQRML